MAGTHIVERREVKAVRRPVVAEVVPLSRRPAYQAFQLLRVGYTILPLVAGLDKFLNLLTSWDMYLASPVEKLLPVTPHTFMMISGVVEIAAALLVAIAPRIGAFVVAAWLAGITFNLLLPPGYYDIALRDFGLMIGALALGLLARRYHGVKTVKAPVQG
jgi:hypothetical protein